MTHNVRFTIKCPRLAQHKAKGIPPDYMKDRIAEEKANGLKGKDAVIKVSKEITNQEAINGRYNERGIELGEILIEKLTGVDMTWCNDGCVVISCCNTMEEVEKVIEDEGLEIQIDKSEIKHKVRAVSDVEGADNEEDIDEVFEPKVSGELKKLKCTHVTNKCKI